MDLEARMGAHLALWVPLAKDRESDNWAKLFVAASKTRPKNAPPDVVSEAWAWWNKAEKNLRKPEDTPWKVKWIYRALLPTSEPIHPRLEKLEHVNTWDNAWEYLDKMPTRGKTGEFRWRNWQNKLRTKWEGKTRAKCTCGATATSEHVANECHIAHYLPLANSILIHTDTTITEEQWRRDWLNHDDTAPEVGVEETADIVMTLTKYEAWKRHAEAVYGNAPYRLSTRTEITTALREAAEIAKKGRVSRRTQEAIKSTLHALDNPPSPPHPQHPTNPPNLIPEIPDPKTTQQPSLPTPPPQNPQNRTTDQPTD